MRHQMKAFGPVLAIVAALFAVLGTASASATVTCKTNTTPCTSIYPVGTTVSASLKEGTELTVAAGFSTLKCKESAISGEITAAGSSVLTTGWTFGISMGNCNATLTTLHSGHVVAHWEAGTMFGNFTLTEWSWEAVAGTTKCFYGGMVTSGIKGEPGEPATIKLTNAEMARETGSSALCANPAKINAVYTVTAPGSIYFAES